jgi:hypothetical protein
VHRISRQGDYPLQLDVNHEIDAAELGPLRWITVTFPALVTLFEDDAAGTLQQVFPNARAKTPGLGH